MKNNGIDDIEASCNGIISTANTVANVHNDHDSYFNVRKLKLC